MISEKFDDFYFNVHVNIENNKIISSIRQGCIMVIPVFMIGAFALVFPNFPILAVRNFIENAFGGVLLSFFNYIYEATFGMGSVYILMAVTYKYSTALTRRISTLNMTAVIVAFISYLTLLGEKPTIALNNKDVSVLAMSYLDISNVFSAVFVAILATKLFLQLHLLTAKHIGKGHTDNEIRNSVGTIMPMVVTISVFSMITTMIKIFTPYTGFNQFVTSILTKPFINIGRNFAGASLVLIGESLLWFFGIHGNNTFDAVNLSIFSDVTGEILTLNTINVFVLMGGCGTTICLLIALAIFSKNKYNKVLVKKAFIPMLFNINEILIFGLPIVLNPTFIIPFILVPVVSLFVSYMAMSFGIVPIPVNVVSWTEPIIFSGYHATETMAGAVLQIFNVLLGILIYLPFIKINDRIQQRHFQKMIDILTQALKKAERDNKEFKFSKLPNNLSKTVQDMVEALLFDIQKGQVDVYYQPQVNHEGRVISGEALLRWNASLDTHIYPPLVIAIAKEYDCYDKLTTYIIERVLSDIRIMAKQYGIENTISVNIDANQLMNFTFINWVINMNQMYHIPKNMFGLEITENDELLENNNLPEIFSRLQKKGISLAIDDFSMGHTSLTYLQSNSFDFVKLDGSMIQNLLVNERSKEIIESIIALGKSLEFESIAEYVETKEQQQALEQMGCKIYQGHLYSPAINFDEYVEYINSMNEIK